MNDFNIRNDESVYECLWFPNRPRLIINRYGNTASEEEVKSLNYSTFFDYYKKYIEEIFVEKSKTPHIIVETEGSFPHLRNYIYPNEVVNYLNEQGLTIYLRELPYIGTTPKLDYASGAVIDAGLNSAYETIQRARSLLTGFNSVGQDLICYEFEEIQNFVKNNNLKKVTVVTGHVGIDTAFKIKYPEFQIYVEDMCHGMMVRPSKTDSFSYVSYNKNSQIPHADKIEYKFWCSNKSYEAYREIIAAYMLDKSALLSFIHRNFDYSVRLNGVDISINELDFYWQDINHRLWFDIHSLRNIDAKKYAQIIIGLRKLKTVGNLYIDKNPAAPDYEDWMDSSDRIAFDDPVPFNQYSKCFCALVTESLFAYPFGNFGDKVMNAVKCFRPIVLAGAPRSLEFMKSRGLKTFSNYWDESYDLEENHEKRLIKVLKVVDYINSKSLDELKDMYRDMIPILEYNHRHIATFAPNKA